MIDLRVPVILTAAMLAACGTNPQQPAADQRAPVSQPASDLQRRNQAILLVSLDDGTVIMQKIDSSADVCFKINSDSATTCLRAGIPVVNPDTDEVVGYEMIRERIDLIAKSD